METTKQDAAAEKELKQILIWKLDKLLTRHYRELYFRTGFDDLLEQIHAQHPGREIAELILAIFKRDGKEGLQKFYSLLEELEENVSLDLIRKSSAYELFRSKSENQIGTTEMQNIQKNNNDEGLMLDLRVSFIESPPGNVTPYYFPSGQQLPLIWYSSRRSDLHTLLVSKQVVILQSLISERLALEYCHQTTYYNAVIQLNCINETQLLDELKKLAEWFRIPLTKEYRILRSRLFQRIKEDKVLLVLSSSRSLRTLLANDLLQLRSESCHILIPVSEPIEGSSNFYTLDSTDELSWATKECQLFLSLMKFVEQRTALASVIMYSKHFIPQGSEKTLEVLKRVLQPLVAKEIISFKSEEISVALGYKAPQWNETDMMRIWIEILNSTNHLPTSDSHFESKSTLFTKLLSMRPWQEIDKDLKVSFLNAFIEFFGFRLGEYYIAAQQTFNFHFFQDYHTQCCLLETLIDMHPPQTRYPISNSRGDRIQVMKRTKNTAIEATTNEDIANSTYIPIIARFCYAHYLAEQGKWTDADKQLRLCEELLETRNIDEYHPLAIKVCFLQAQVLHNLKDSNLSTIIMKFQSCHSRLMKRYKDIKCHPALTDIQYHLGVTLMKEEKWVEAADHLTNSILGQLKGSRLASYTLNTVAALLKCYVADPYNCGENSSSDDICKHFTETIDSYWSSYGVTHQRQDSTSLFGQIYKVRELITNKNKFIEMEYSKDATVFRIIIQYDKELMIAFCILPVSNESEDKMAI